VRAITKTVNVIRYIFISKNYSYHLVVMKIIPCKYCTYMVHLVTSVTATSTASPSCFHGHLFVRPVLTSLYKNYKNIRPTHKSQPTFSMLHFITNLHFSGPASAIGSLSVRVYSYRRLKTLEI